MSRRAASTAASQRERKRSQTATAAASNSRRLHVPRLHPPLRLLLALYLYRFLLIPLHVWSHPPFAFPSIPTPLILFFVPPLKEWGKQVHKIPEANSAPQNSGTQYVTTTVERRRQAEGERQSVRKRGGGAGSVWEIRENVE